MEALVVVFLTIGLVLWGAEYALGLLDLL